VAATIYSTMVESTKDTKGPFQSYAANFSTFFYSLLYDTYWEIK